MTCCNTGNLLFENKDAFRHGLLRQITLKIYYIFNDNKLNVYYSVKWLCMEPLMEIIDDRKGKKPMFTNYQWNDLLIRSFLFAFIYLWMYLHSYLYLYFQNTKRQEVRCLQIADGIICCDWSLSQNSNQGQFLESWNVWWMEFIILWNSMESLQLLQNLREMSNWPN